MSYICSEFANDKKNVYLATSTDDIANLPRVGVEGTQADNPTDDEPCNYGSTCIVATGSETSVYELMPNNEWVKL